MRGEGALWCVSNGVSRWPTGSPKASAMQTRLSTERFRWPSSISPMYVGRQASHGAKHRLGQAALPSVLTEGRPKQREERCRIVWLGGPPVMRGHDGIVRLPMEGQRITSRCWVRGGRGGLVVPGETATGIPRHAQGGAA